ncbi:hypothetical protein FACS1894158_09170 [Betaproteobacteria bacterium]|nr:hypothetical protein FACS1894158_09170 [Betaproteobacteria bacterium]
MKYGDKDIVDMIMERSIWIDQTEDQLLDSWGKPDDIEHKATTKKAQVEEWRYGQTGKNRYKTRVTLKNGIVTKYT